MPESSRKNHISSEYKQKWTALIAVIKLKDHWETDRHLHEFN